MELLSTTAEWIIVEKIYVWPEMFPKNYPTDLPKSHINLWQCKFLTWLKLLAAAEHSQVPVVAHSNVPIWTDAGAIV